MSERAKTDRPQHTGNVPADGISRRAFLAASAVGTGAAAAAGAMPQAATASVEEPRFEGPRPAKPDELKSDNPLGLS